MGSGNGFQKGKRFPETETLKISGKISFPETEISEKIRENPVSGNVFRERKYWKCPEKIWLPETKTLENRKHPEKFGFRKQK